jgi:hypothetical protein
MTRGRDMSAADITVHQKDACQGPIQIWPYPRDMAQENSKGSQTSHV